MKIIHFAFIATILLGTACGQEESLSPEVTLNSTVEQPKLKNYTVENGMLVFNDMETLFATQEFIRDASDEDIDTWEASLGFTSYSKDMEEKGSALEADNPLYFYAGIINPEGFLRIGPALHHYDAEKLSVELLGQKGTDNGKSAPATEKTEMTYYYSALTNRATGAQGAPSTETLDRNETCQADANDRRTTTKVISGSSVYFDAARGGSYVNDYLRVVVSNEEKPRRRWKAKKSRWLRVNASYTVNFIHYGQSKTITNTDYYQRTPSNKKSHSFSLFEAYSQSGRYGNYNNNVTVTGVSGSFRGRGSKPYDVECTVTW